MRPALARGLFAVLIALFVAAPARAQTQTSAAPEEVPNEIILGFNPAENAQGLQVAADRLASMVSERVQIPVRAFVSLDYTAEVEAMRSRQVHFGWLLPASLVLAEQLFHAQVLLTQVRHGSPTYRAAIVVREDSPVHSAGDLRGRTIAWVDPQSTSGYVIPRYLLSQQGYDPSQLFRQQVFAGGHDAAVFAVQRGQVDAAAVWADPPEDGTGAWTRFTRNRPPRLRPVLYSPPVPSDAVAVHPEFARAHPRLVASVQAALIALAQTPEGREVLRQINGTDGFVPANTAQYDYVRQAFRSVRASRPAGGARFERPVSVALFVLFALTGLALALSFLWRGARGARARVYTGWALFLGSSAWAFVAAELSFTKLWEGRGAMGLFVRGMFPPDRSVLPAVLESTMVTVQLALVGTLLAVPLALVFGFLAAENVNPSRLGRGLVRLLLNVNRSVDTLILALVLVSAVGLGPLPGVTALALHSVGSLAKLFYEAIETLDPGPADAMRSVGATPLQVLRWGVWPLFAPHFVSIVLFRFELNVRVSTVLGLVGAGGIGFLLMTYMRGAEYGKVTAVIGAIVLLVMALDAASTRLRKNVQ